MPGRSRSAVSCLLEVCPAGTLPTTDIATAVMNVGNWCETLGAAGGSEHGSSSRLPSHAHAYGLAGTARLEQPLKPVPDRAPSRQLLDQEN